VSEAKIFCSDINYPPQSLGVLLAAALGSRVGWATITECMAAAIYRGDSTA
jgi:hypothetical protein